jgi:predicted nucleic acid-binding protein
MAEKRKQILVTLDTEIAEMLERVKKKMEKEGYPPPTDAQIARTALKKYLSELLKEK